MDHQYSISARIVRVFEAAILLVAGIFLALHAFNLNADFPNHSPWMDWAKYTDEGWYGDGAIRHFQRGHWYVPGDFNPAAALPVWPILEGAIFRFTGVNLVAARGLAVAIFSLILFVSYLLLRRWQSSAARRSPASLTPAIAVLMLAVSPFCYVFFRMAILEPLLILFTLLALLAASFAVPLRQRAGSMSNQIRTALPLLALGLLIPLMVLTKTTAIFLVPAIAWLLWARSGYRAQAFLRMALPVAVLGAVTWIGYYLLVVRPHFLLDYRYLFDANGYTGMTPSTVLTVLGTTIADGLWMGKIIYPLSIAAVVAVFLLRPRLLHNPLIPALLLWAFGYTSFLAYHNNPQPRYYMVLAVPLTLLVSIVLSSLLTALHQARRTTAQISLRRLAVTCLATVLVVLLYTDARQTLHYVRHPDYSFAKAAAQIDRIVSADRTHNPLILSISGSDLSLMTGLPSICDDFGTMDLQVRIQAYKPGWYIAWNQVDDDKMDALAPLYRLQRVAAFPAFDDPERNLLILYRLDPATPNLLPHLHRKPAMPRLLQAGFGQPFRRLQLDH
jgi:hypothetical protein